MDMVAATGENQDAKQYNFQKTFKAKDFCFLKLTITKIILFIMSPKAND